MMTLKLNEYSNISLLFKNNELIQGSSIMIIATVINYVDSHEPGFWAYKTEFKFENNSILYDSEYKFKKGAISAVLLCFKSTVAFDYVSMLFINNSVPAGGIFVMMNSEIDGNSYFNAKFENNKGSDGGAMAFYERSYILSRASVHFIFSNNQAQKREGQYLLKILSILILIV